MELAVAKLPSPRLSRAEVAVVAPVPPFSTAIVPETLPAVVAVTAVVAEDALPFKLAVMVPAAKSPFSSRVTIALAVLAFVAEVAELATFPGLEMFASLVSAMAALSLISMLAISPSVISAAVTVLFVAKLPSPDIHGATLSRGDEPWVVGGCVACCSTSTCIRQACPAILHHTGRLRRRNIGLRHWLRHPGTTTGMATALFFFISFIIVVPRRGGIGVTGSPQADTGCGTSCTLAVALPASFCTFLGGGRHRSSCGVVSGGRIPLAHAWIVETGCEV